MIHRVRSVAMYWWNDRPNFGDGLNPVLVERLFGVRPVWTELERAVLVGAGSILQHVSRVVREGATGEKHVWGAGYISDFEQPPVSGGAVTYHAVRGRLTQSYGGVGEVPFGDPGILSPLLLDRRVPKKHAVGLVPHYIHRQDPELLGTEGHVIEVDADPLDVVREIAACEVVYSSSLHGLVVADAFGIPNQRLVFDRAVNGGDWKFRDYYSGFGLDAPPAIRCAAINGEPEWQVKDVEPMQQGLLKAFPRLSAR